ncbi:toxin-antitoxin system, toxin component family protein [Streptomyces sp. NPDC002845]
MPHLSIPHLSISRSRAARSRSGSELRDLAAALTAALRARVGDGDGDEPVDARELCRMLCEEMSARRGGRRIDLRFERFPDEIEVTGLWLEFQDFDLVIVEERAEAVQQLVILGHELWHLHAGHCHRHMTGAAAAARALADQPGWRELALTVAARNGSHEAEERQAEDFGHRLAANFRTWLDGSDTRASTDPVGRAIQVSLGYRHPQRGPHSAAPQCGTQSGPQSGPRSGPRR